MAMPPRDHKIPFVAAAALTRRYREQPRRVSERAGAFHADQVRELLAQKGCVGLRIYYGTHEDARAALILVGMDANDRDLTAGTLLEFMYPCPPLCDDGGGL